MIDEVRSNYFDGGAGLGNSNSPGGRSLVDILNELIGFANDLEIEIEGANTFGEIYEQEPGIDRVIDRDDFDIVYNLVTGQYKITEDGIDLSGGAILKVNSGSSISLGEFDQVSMYWDNGFGAGFIDVNEGYFRRPDWSNGFGFDVDSVSMWAGISPDLAQITLSDVGGVQKIVINNGQSGSGEDVDTFINGASGLISQFDAGDLLFRMLDDRQLTFGDDDDGEILYSNTFDLFAILSEKDMVFGSAVTGLGLNIDPGTPKITLSTGEANEYLVLDTGSDIIQARMGNNDWNVLSGKTSFNESLNDVDFEIWGSKSAGTLVFKYDDGNDLFSLDSPIEITGTTSYFKVPVLTTAQKGALTPSNGMFVYDSTLNKFQGYENGAWTSLI